MDYWVGHLKLPDHIQYLVENKVSKLNKKSPKEDWLECIAGLRKFKHYIWHCHVEHDKGVFPSHLWTLVHHAAYHKAPISILQIMNVDKYPLSLPDGEGKLPSDHLCPNVEQTYKDLLKPNYKLNIMPLELKLIQVNFHAVILDRVGALIEKYNLVLPILTTHLEDISKHGKVYFDVPGMYGGFTYWFEYDRSKTEIIALWSCSSSKLVQNSEQLHKCTSEGWSLIKRGSHNANGIAYS